MAGSLLIAYTFAWWAVFWLPMRKSAFANLAFMPAVICAFGIPIMVGGVNSGTRQLFLIFWASTPFLVAGAELIWHLKKNVNPNQPSHSAIQPGKADFL